MVNSQRARSRTTIQSSNPVIEYTPEEYKAFYCKDTCTQMLIAALFTTAKTLNQPKCSSMTDWLKKMWYRYTMENYAAMEKNKIMYFAKTWMSCRISSLAS